MSKVLFLQRVRKHFEYLVVEHGFSVVAERYDSEAFGNGVVQFQSSSVTITVTLDRGQVLIDVEPYPGIPAYRFDLNTVVEFLAPEAGIPVYVFPDKWDDYSEMVDWQTARLAGILKQYCIPILRGQFFKWEEMHRMRVESAAGKHKAITGVNPLRITSRKAKEALQEEMDRRRRRIEKET